MSYPVISGRRMPYDIDGSEVGVSTPPGSYTGYGVSDSFNQGITGWLNSADKQYLNNELRSYELYIGGRAARCLWFFFPESREVTHIGLLWPSGSYSTAGFVIQGSNDTTNGMDGTWETGAWTFPGYNVASDFWRSTIQAISFSESKKVIRMRIDNTTSYGYAICSIHVYGQKAAGQTPDDIVFVDSVTGVEFTSLTDWLDRPEGTTEIRSFRLKNASPDKIAYGVNIQLNHGDFAISFDPGGQWGTVLDIESLGIGALSNQIYVKNALNPPLLTLGPKASRSIVLADHWA